jgi:hypothetical protein
MTAFRTRTMQFVLAGALGAIPIHASSIAINNPSFETVANVAGCSSSNTLVLGEFISTDNLGSGCVYADPFNGTWAVSGDVGVWAPSTTFYPGGVPNGESVAFTNNGSVSQILGSTAQLGGYTLSLDIGGRCDVPNTNYTVELLAGATVIASDNNSKVPLLATPSGSGCGTFVADTLSGNVTAPLVGQALEMVLSSAGSNDTSQATFDALSLTFQGSSSSTPEPGSLGLALVGAIPLAVGLLQRRKSPRIPALTSLCEK